MIDTMATVAKLILTQLAQPKDRQRIHIPKLQLLCGAILPSVSVEVTTAPCDTPSEGDCVTLVFELDPGSSDCVVGMEFHPARDSRRKAFPHNIIEHASIEAWFFEKKTEHGEYMGNARLSQKYKASNVPTFAWGQPRVPELLMLAIDEMLLHLKLSNALADDFVVELVDLFVSPRARPKRTDWRFGEHGAWMQKGMTSRQLEVERGLGYYERFGFWPPGIKVQRALKYAASLPRFETPLARQRRISEAQRAGQNALLGNVRSKSFPPTLPPLKQDDLPRRESANTCNQHRVLLSTSVSRQQSSARFRLAVTLC